MPRNSLVEQKNSRVEQKIPSLERTLAAAGFGFSSGDRYRANKTMEAITRTGVTYTGSQGGFALKPEQSASVWDRARTEIGPFNLINWRPIRYKNFWLPSYNELSKVSGSRWGGAVSTIGLSEIADLSTKPNGTSTVSNPQLSRVTFDMKRLAVYATNSRDNLRDSALVEPMIDYVSKSEIRVLVDEALVGGNSINANTGPNVVSPMGILSAPCVVTPTRATSNTIKSTDLDALWSSLTPACQRKAYWHASSETIQYLDQALISGAVSETIYVAAGRFNNEFGLIKGRPLIPCDASSAYGTDGDIVIADWSQYWMYYHRDEQYKSDLSFNIIHPDDLGHQGVWGMPPELIESRKSEDFLFSSDLAAFLFLARMDGAFTWTTTTQNQNGVKQGPCAALRA